MATFLSWLGGRGAGRCPGEPGVQAGAQGVGEGGLGPQPDRPPPPQEWDYTYVHSFYHCALAMSFVLLLPKVNKKAGSAGAPAKLNCSTLCCACI